MSRKLAVVLLAAVLGFLPACKPSPRSFVIDPTLVPARQDSAVSGAALVHLAVLPLANYTPSRDAADRLGPMLAAELAAKPDIAVADAGAVQAALDQEPWLLLDRVPPDLVDRLGGALGVEALVVGSLLTYEYRDAAGDRVPQVSISLRLVQCPGGRLLWTAVHSRDGDDSEWLFGFGRVHNLEQLAMETLREMLDDIPAPRREARHGSGAQEGK